MTVEILGEIKKRDKTKVVDFLGSQSFENYTVLFVFLPQVERGFLVFVI